MGVLKMEDKYGFVYIWYDRKHKRYYIGCRWGKIEDGYVCSSSWMKKSYKRRPQDFKRRILQTNIVDKQALLQEEYKWLQLIKHEELGKRYYNLHNHHFGHWSANEQKRLAVGQKISASPLRNERIRESQIGKRVSDETKNKLSLIATKQWEAEESREVLRKKSKDMWQNPEYRERQKIARSREGFYRGNPKPPSEETKEKLRKANLGRPSPMKGKPSPIFRDLRWFTNGYISVRQKECPEGFWAGKMDKRRILNRSNET